MKVVTRSRVPGSALGRTKEVERDLRLVRARNGSLVDASSVPLRDGAQCGRLRWIGTPRRAKHEMFFGGVRMK